MASSFLWESIYLFFEIQCTEGMIYSVFPVRLVHCLWLVL